MKLEGEEEAVFIRHSSTKEEEEVVVVVFTRENRGGPAQHATRATGGRGCGGGLYQ